MTEEHFLEELDIDLNQDAVSGEIKDSRISDLIDECVKVKLTYDSNKVNKEAKKDIEIDFAKLLNITNPSIRRQINLLKDVNIKRRKVNGNKFYIFLKNFKIILSYMNENEIKKLISMRLLCEKWHKYNKTKIEEMLDGILLTFAEFCNRFLNEVDPIAYTPKCKTMEDKSLQELYFSEDHLKYLVKVIVISKITLLFTDNVHKDKMKEAKREIARKIWDLEFVDADKKIDIKNKIQKLISSRFVSTEYNEKRFWAAAKYANITITSQENLLYNEIRTDSILMLEFDKNPLSFLDVFLKNTIYYLSKRKFPLEFILNNFDAQINNMNSDLSTEFKLNLLEERLMNRSVDKFIKTDIKKYTSDSNLIEEFKSNFKKNILHFWIIIPYMSKILNIPSMYLTSLHKDKFVYLVIYVYYRLINMKCFIMSELIKSNMKENTTGVYNENVKNMSVLVSRYLKNEELLEFLNEEKFNNNINDISKLVINPIITMTMNKFYSFNNEQITFSVQDLISEYITFIQNYTKL